MKYESYETVASVVTPGVSYTVTRMSFGRRVDLSRRIRDLAARKEFVEAGQSADERMEAALLAAAIDRVYLEWGLKQVSGLEVDGAAADPAMLIECGPEELMREALAAVKQQCGLSEDERKN